MLPRSPAEPNKPVWDAATTEDARLRPMLNRIEDQRRAGLTSLMVVTDFLCHQLAP